MTSPDFNDTEQQLTSDALKECDKKKVVFQLADVEVRAGPVDRSLGEFTAVFCSKQEANFVVEKSGGKQFRCQFYYHPHKQYSTGGDTYDELGDGRVTILRCNPIMNMNGSFHQWMTRPEIHT